jgi:hypothetical protein
MARRIDPRLHNNFIDANFWDSSDNPLDNSAAREILHLESEGEITLILPFSVKIEIAHPKTPSHVQSSASCMIYTEPTELTSNERAIHANVLKIIQGNANPGKHDRDVMHLFEAHKYGGGYFITKDKRLLEKKREIEGRLSSLRIVSPSDFIGLFSYDACTKNSSHLQSPVEHSALTASTERNMRIIIYKGYVIRPAPLLLTDGRWNHEVYVSRDRGNEVIERKFSSASLFATREEAISHCVNFARQIIDGTVPNCSVSDL